MTVTVTKKGKNMATCGENHNVALSSPLLLFPRDQPDDLSCPQQQRPPFPAHQPLQGTGHTPHGITPDPDNESQCFCSCGQVMRGPKRERKGNFVPGSTLSVNGHACVFASPALHYAHFHLTSPTPDPRPLSVCVYVCVHARKMSHTKGFRTPDCSAAVPSSPACFCFSRASIFFCQAGNWCWAKCRAVAMHSLRATP